MDKLNLFCALKRAQRCPACTSSGINTISISRTFEPISQRQSTELIAEKLGRGEEGRAALRLSSGQRLNFSPEGCASTWPHTYLLVRLAQKGTCGYFAHKRLEPGETEGILL